MTRTKYVTPGPFGLYSDAARRASDMVTMHMLADREHAVGKWVALRLSDGGSDGTLYNYRADAVRHQLHESLCCYLKIPPDGLTPRSAEIFLKFNRSAYDTGLRMTDPDCDRELVMPLGVEELVASPGATAAIEREFADRFRRAAGRLDDASRRTLERMGLL
jgi:hypothetical protein